MQQGAGEAEVNQVVERLTKLGFGVHVSRGVEKTVIGAVGDRRAAEPDDLQTLPGVERVVPVMEPYKLASRHFHPDDTVIQVGEVEIGGSEVVMMAGPCAVESREQLLETARAVKAAGARLLRGGAFKPRTSPYAFQGLGEEGLKLLAETREATGLPVITEVMDTRDVDRVAYYADILQLGARNAQNFSLLKELGRVGKPVLVKRGMHTTIEEWLLSAEYVMASGNHQVILGERGIRTFETATRNTLDLSAVALVKMLSHLPVLVDPTQGTGKNKLVAPMSLAAVAAGADALLVEVHYNPRLALCDGPQALTTEQFADLMRRLRPVAEAVGRTMAGAESSVRVAAEAAETAKAPLASKVG